MKLKTIFKIIIVFSIAVPAAIIAIVGSTCFSSFYKAMVAEEVSSAAYSGAASCAQIFKRYEYQLASISCLDSIRKAAGGDYNSNADEVDGVIAEIMTDNTITDLIIMDSNGLAVTAYNPSVTMTSYYQSDLLSGIGNSETYISPVSFQEKYGGNGMNVLYIIKPVAAANDARGYVAMVIGADQFSARLSTISFFDLKGSVMLSDGENTVLNVGGSQLTFDEALDSGFITEDVINSAVPSGVSSVSFEYNGYYGAYGMISGTNWRWIGILPASSTNVTIAFAVLMGLAVIATFIVIDSLLAFGIYRRAITPIGKIINTMKEINDGDRSKRLPNFKTYEHQVISEIFNDMLDDFYVSEDVYKTIANLSASMLFEWDIEKRAMFLSDNFKDLFNVNEQDATLTEGGFLDSLMNEVDARHFKKDLEALTEGRKEYADCEYQVKTLRNTEIWVNVKASVVSSRRGDITKVIGVVTDINNKKKSALQLSQKASYDFLSKLYNRSTFLKEMQKMLDMRRSNENYAVLFLDVDDFKYINDRYGHNVGDEVIKYVADTIKSCIGAGGIAGRFGGDEFVMCVTDAEKVEDVENFAMGIIDKLYEGYDCSSLEMIIKVKASIGVSLIPEHGKSAEKLVGAADEAMYFVKKNGKANYHIYDPEDAPDLDLDNTII